jgi:hypothetical protein
MRRSGAQRYRSAHSLPRNVRLQGYLAHLSAQQSGLDEELYYRISHGSYKGLSWARDLAVRWLSLFAQYVLEVEPEYLPLPTTPGPTVDYVHYHLSPEALYAVTVMLSAGMSPVLLDEVYQNRFARSGYVSVF